MQIIVVYGLRFQRGKWRDWEHICSVEEVEGVLDSARAKAFDHGRLGQPTHSDYLEGSRYMFNVARGPRDNPADGDTQLYGVCVDGIVIGEWGHLKEHFASR